MVKLTVPFFGRVDFSSEMTERTWSIINDLVEDGAHRDVAGIRGEEECVRGRKTQGRSR